MSTEGGLAATLRDIDELLKSCLDSGILDEQFLQLRELQDESIPNFLSEMTELYFEDSSKKIEQLGSMIHAETVDFSSIDALVHQFKGSSASFGAKKMVALCVDLRQACQEQSVAACAHLHGQVKIVFEELREALTKFLELEARRKVVTVAESNQ